MNDSIEENGLVPSLLNFGFIPRFPVTSSSLPSRRDRMEVLSEANKEMSKIVAERRIQAALERKIPLASERIYYPEDKIIIFREESKEWKGPYRVLDFDFKRKVLTVVNTHSKNTERYIGQQVQPYIRKNMENQTIHPDEFFHNPISPFRTKNRPVPPVFHSYLTEVILPGDPCSNYPIFAKEKEKEMGWLIDRGTWKVVLNNEVPADANILCGRFFLTIKDE